MCNRGSQLRSRAEGKKKMDSEIARVEARKKAADAISTIVEEMLVQLLVASVLRDIN